MGRWDFSGGIPFVVFADSSRRRLATSLADGGSGGWPATAAQIAAFAEVLHRVAPRMTVEERDVLLKWLRGEAR
ncbi:MAG TPA: hypothetical protein VFV78_15150 [Vicinamibacterales bacterium]|nr:hypothetical protein [Vicinamibacterales bacterium]